MMITLEFLDKVITTLENDYDLKIEMLSTKIDALSARIQILESLVEKPEINVHDMWGR